MGRKPAQDSEEKFNISAMVPKNLYADLLEYCRLHQVSKSDVVRQALIRELQGGRDFHILQQCERLIDAKLKGSVIIDVPVKK